MAMYEVSDRYLYPQNETASQDFVQRVMGTIDRKAYDDARNDPAAIPAGQTPQFQRPELYFWATNYKFRVLGTALELDIRNKWTRTQEERLREYVGSQWNRESVLFVYNYLQALIFPSYYNALLEFKWAAQLTVFPLFDCYERIQVIEGKLYGYFPDISQNDLAHASGDWHLLTEDIVSREIRHHKGNPDVSDRLIKKLIKELIKAHQNDPNANIESKQELTVQYRQGKIEYIPVERKAHFHSEPARSDLFYIALTNTKDPAHISVELEDTLWNLTDGKLERLDLLAELFARIFCENIPSRYVWHISDPTGHFLRWVNTIIENRSGFSAYADRAWWRKHAWRDHSNHILLQYNKRPYTTEEFAALNHNSLKELIENGYEISPNDYQSFEPEQYTPAILYVSCQERFNTKDAFKKLPRKDIIVPQTWETHFLSSADKQWLRTCFVAYGLQIINVGGFEKGSTSSNSVENTVREFVNLFCEFDSDCWTNCKEFYEALNRYTQTLPYELSLGGSTTMSKQIEEWMGWTRKDIRKDNNRKAFMGVKLNQTKLDETIRENLTLQENRKQTLAASRFHEYLEDISSMVIWPT